MKSAIRVALWGPGLVGSTALREIIGMPEFELVGVLVYSPGKAGRDVGELLGLDSIGLAATNDREQFLALEADIVIYTARDYGDPEGTGHNAADEDILQLLRSGKNVLTTLPYHYPRMRGPELADKLEAACTEGQSTLFATGFFPGYIPEHVASTLTIPVNNLQSVEVMEIFDTGGVSSPDLLTAFGYGQPFLEDDRTSPAWQLSKSYYAPSVQLLADAMGVTLDRIESECHSLPAPEDMNVKGLEIAKGTVAAVAYDWIGYVDGKPFITLKLYWYVHESMRHEEAISPECWIVTVEGTPSFQCKIDVKESFARDKRLDSENRNFAMSGVLLTRSIVATIQAPPGIKMFMPDERAWRQG